MKILSVTEVSFCPTTLGSTCTCSVLGSHEAVFRLAVKILSVVVVVVPAAAAATPVALARAQLFARTKPWLAVKILSLVGSFYTSDSGSTCTCAARLSLEKGPGAGSFAMHTYIHTGGGRFNVFSRAKKYGSSSRRSLHNVARSSFRCDERRSG